MGRGRCLRGRAVGLARESVPASLGSSLTYVAGGGGVVGIESSSNPWVRCFGFSRTRIVSGLGFRMFQPALMIAPPATVITRNRPNVRKTIAIGRRTPAKSRLRFSPAPVGVLTPRPDRVSPITVMTWATARLSFPFASRTTRLAWYVVYDEYVCVGFCALPRCPSPKSQSHKTIWASPARLESAKVTVASLLVQSNEADGPVGCCCCGSWLRSQGPGFVAIANACEKVNRMTTRPSARIPIPRISSKRSRFKRTTCDLGSDPPVQLVDGQLGLRLRRTDPDVEGSALDLLLAHDDDVGDPLLFRATDLLGERIVRVVEVDSDLGQSLDEAAGVVELVCAHGHDSYLRGRQPDREHRRLPSFRVGTGLLEEGVHDPLDRAARREVQDQRMPLFALLIREGDAEPFRVFRVDLVRRQVCRLG